MAAQPIDVQPQPQIPLAQDLEAPIKRMGAELLAVMVDELRSASANWQQMTKQQQDRVINRLRDTIRRETEVAMNHIAAGSFEVARVKVEKIVVKDGAKAEITIADNLHRTIDRVGLPAVLVMCDPAQFFSGLHELEGEDEQRALNLGTVESDETSGFDSERHEPPGDDDRDDSDDSDDSDDEDEDQD